MNIDFHTHRKLAKNLPFSNLYTDWLIEVAKKTSLDAICLTEHFNTIEFDKLYNYIKNNSEKDGDSLIFNDFRIFPGMEIDIKEKGHILVLGSIEEILELNQELSPNKKVSDFLPFSDLLKILKNYNLILGAAHPFRPGGNIPNLKENEIKEFDFLDLNGKDMANNKDYAINNTRKLSNTYNIPVVAGSDTHQALQYGCTWTNFEEDINTFSKLKREIELENYKIQVSQSINSQVKSAGLLKKALKEIHSLGGDYVQILLQE